MDLFAMLIGLVLVAASGLMIGLPLVRPVREGIYNEPGIRAEESLEKRKEAIFTTLNEIEFDYRTNKLSEEDYKSLQNKYKSQAVEILKLEELKQGKAGSADKKTIEAQVEAEIEQEVALLLKQRNKS